MTQQSSFRQQLSRTQNVPQQSGNPYPPDYDTAVALGLVSGASTWNKFGYNEDVDAGLTEVIAEFGGAFAQNIGTAETLNIVSSSANDATGGTGLRTAVIFGVDNDWNEIIDVVAMNGTTPVTSNLSFLGVNRLTIYQSGSASSNVGSIAATSSSGGITMATMPAGQGTSQQCIFYVPAGKTFLASWLYLSAIKSSGGGTAEVTFYAYVYADLVGSQFEVFRDTIDLSTESHLNVKSKEPFVITEKSIFWIEADSDSANTSVRGRFSGKLVSS